MVFPMQFAETFVLAKLDLTHESRSFSMCYKDQWQRQKQQSMHTQEHHWVGIIKPSAFSTSLVTMYSEKSKFLSYQR